MTWLKSLQHTVVGAAATLLPFAFNWANSKWGDVTLSVIFLFVYHKVDAYLTAQSAKTAPAPTQ